MKAVGKLIVCAAVIVTAVLIFNASDENAFVSSVRSEQMTERLVKMYYLFVGKTDFSGLKEDVKALHPTVRELGHVGEFFLLSAFLTALLSSSSGSKLRNTLSGAVAFAVTVLYALTDEYHQMFVVGRVSDFADVCEDSVGALLGATLVTVAVCVLRKRQHRKTTVKKE